MKDNSEVQNRRVASLRRSLGPVIRDALNATRIVEVMVNADGRIWFDEIGKGCYDSGETITPHEAETTLRLIASSIGEPISRDNPRLSGVLPETYERIQGQYPPLVEAPVFTIRKPPAVIFTLANYVEQDSLDEAQAEYLNTAVREKHNIIIAGGTGSGKTTFANALLRLPAYADERIVIIEDTPELQCSAENRINLLTKNDEPKVTIRDLVVDTLRHRPDRIVVGEIRDGAAHDVLKAWNTGHPGGLCTLHANSAGEALERLEELIGEHPHIGQQSEKTIRGRIARTIDTIVFIERTDSGRRVKELVKVEHYSASEGYDLQSAPTKRIPARYVS